MKLTFIIFLFISIQHVCANIMVMDRDSNQNLKSKFVPLDGLYMDHLLESKYFKVVRKDSNEIIEIDPNGENAESLRAQTVFYHLNKARKYFKILGINQESQITVRIGIETEYHKKYHYKSGSKKKIYNNAHTIQPGSTWGHEIWFRDPKEEEFSQEYLDFRREHLRGIVPLSRDISMDYFINLVLYTGLSYDPVSYLSSSAKRLGNDLIISGIAKYITPEVVLFFLAEDTYFLDTAMIPEVSYHEYTHYIMSDYLPSVVNTPIMEGLSDYFATKILNYSKLSHKLGNFGQEVQEKNSEKKVKYDPKFDMGHGEGQLQKGAAFVLRALQVIDTYLTEKENINYAPKVYYEMRKYLSINSQIATDLPQAILSSLPFKYRLGILTRLSNINL